MGKESSAKNLALKMIIGTSIAREVQFRPVGRILVGAGAILRMT
jgi:hypothetical protein